MGADDSSGGGGKPKSKKTANYVVFYQIVKKKYRDGEVVRWEFFAGGKCNPLKTKEEAIDGLDSIESRKKELWGRNEVERKSATELEIDSGSSRRDRRTVYCVESFKVKKQK